MKIYLNDRVIELLKQKPEGREHHYISTKMQLAGVVSEFETSPKQKELVLYSDFYVCLKQEFFSLFELVRAAGGMVKNEKGETLFIYRRGRWDLPKGKINNKNGRPREKKAEAALREVMEETGLKEAVVTRKLKKTYHVFYEKRVRMLKKTYWYEMKAHSGQVLTPQAEEDITEVRWIPQEELPQVVATTYPSLKKLFE